MTTSELCPICIENESTCITECRHSYCITCLCKIKKCAMCRKDLVRSQICKEIIGKCKLWFIQRSSSYFNFGLFYQDDFHTPIPGVNVYSLFSSITAGMAGMQGLTYY